MSPLTVAISGASGFIGTALSRALRERGDRVLALVRRPARAAHEVTWHPERHEVDPAAFDGVDVVVNLAGAGVGDQRWSTAYKAEILRSRLASTTTLVKAIGELDARPRLVNASAVGIYGDRGEEMLTEESPAGVGFLAEVVRAWEDAAAPLAEAGVGVSYARTGLVMGGGGAFPRMATLTRLGLGGPLGSGRQFWPVISLRDEVAAYLHLIDTPSLTGPVNLVGSAPVRQREFASALARALHRPAFVPAPAIALRAVLGEFANDVLASQRVLPERLLASGFRHADEGLDAVVAAALTDAD